MESPCFRFLLRREFYISEFMKCFLNSRFFISSTVQAIRLRGVSKSYIDVDIFNS